MLEVLGDIGGIYVIGVMLFIADEDKSLAHAMIWPVRIAKNAWKLARKP